ncbi:MAG TPA: lysylphosphatidylglycerol synthase transmembrane domain-containing protein [Gemmatimonadales bacterium]|nr:lysylphosphatidylglycerol synthase transmembrane domain-containing protein [Gemmatimonadales bacterium]
MGRPWAWAIGLVVTALLLAWALHDVDPRAVLGHIARADLRWLILAIVLATATFPLRTVRWRVILRAADGSRLPWGPLWHATAIGFMANNVLPARAGEVARAYLARRQLPVRFTTALASIGVERVFDGLFLVGLMTLAIAAPSFPRNATVGGVSLARVATWAAVLFSTLLVGALLVVSRPVWWVALFGRAFHAMLPVRTADRLTHLMEGVVAGLAVLTSPGRFLEVAAWSLVLWLVNALSFASCFRAFGLGVPPESALLLQGLIGFGVAIPSSPGFFGPFEAVTRATLAIYGIGAEQAVSYAVAYHIGGFVPITLLGLASLARTHVRLGELRQAEGTGG